MAEIESNLWAYNLAKVVVVDVTDDYRLMQDPLPSICYPVIAEVWLPRYKLIDHLPDRPLVDGYLYDWHETPKDDAGEWVVGVVDREYSKALTAQLLPSIQSAMTGMDT